MGESRLMQERLEHLRLNAAKCRDLANTAITSDARDVLAGLAEKYERDAGTLEREQDREPRRPAFKWKLA